MKDKLYPKTETVSIGYSGFPASKLQVNSEKNSNVRDQHGLLEFRKMEVESGDSKVRDPSVLLPKKCECGRGEEFFSWFGRLFSDFFNRRSIRELVVLSFLFSLALVFKTFVFVKPNLKTAPQLNLVVFSSSTQVWFSYQNVNLEILSLDSIESPRKVTLRRIMSQESQVT